MAVQFLTKPKGAIFGLRPTKEVRHADHTMKRAKIVVRPVKFNEDEEPTHFAASATLKHLPEKRRHWHTEFSHTDAKKAAAVAQEKLFHHVLAGA